MKNIKILLLLISAIFMASCEDEVEDFTGPYDLAIIGSTSVMPETTVEYSLQELANSDAYTWEIVSGPATIVGENTGTSIKVSYQKVGDVVITVGNGGDSFGRIDVTVAEKKPVVTASFGTDNYGVLAAGDQDTVFFEFETSIILDSISFFDFNTEDSTAFNKGKTPFVSAGAVLGALKPYNEVDEKAGDNVYYALFTAGAGNGTPEVRIEDIVATDPFGGLKVDTAYTQLYRVDNIAPVADLSYSETQIKNGSIITVTATFTEEVSFDFSQSLDSALRISLSGAGYEVDKDTLWATTDPLVYTWSDTVESTGNGEILVSLDNVVDLAGQSLGAVNNANKLTLDNTAPVAITGSAQQGPLNDDYITVALNSAESGEGWYTILKDGTPAPTAATGFGSGVVTGSFDLTAAQTSSTKLPVIEPGSYDVYFIAADQAGNYSAIQKVDLTVN